MRRWIWPLASASGCAVLALAVGARMGEDLLVFSLASAATGGLCGLTVSLFQGNLRSRATNIGMGLGCGCGAVAAVLLVMIVMLVVTTMGELARNLDFWMPLWLWLAIAMPLCSGMAIGGVVGQAFRRKQSGGLSQK